jgi:hypothetical protein
MSVMNDEQDKSPEPQIQRAILELDLATSQSNYLLDRLVDQLAWYERKSGSNQKRQNRYRTVVLAGGLMLPVLVNLTATTSSDWVRVISIVVSIVVGLAAGLESLQRPGDKWLQYRQTAERLRSEFWMYANLAGPVYENFSSVDGAYVTLVQRIESIISDDVAGFAALVASSGKPGAAPANDDAPIS